MSTTDPGSPPVTLAMQPTPLVVLEMPGEAGLSRIDTRVWPVGSAARCRICPRDECSALNVLGLVEVCSVRFGHAADRGDRAGGQPPGGTAPPSPPPLPGLTAG